MKNHLDEKKGFTPTLILASLRSFLNRMTPKTIFHTRYSRGEGTGRVAKTIPRLVSGFTLVELIVSMALFTVVVFIVTSAFLTVTDQHKKARTVRAAMDNLAIAMEHMARNIRTSNFYHCGVSSGNINVNDSANLPPKDCDASGSENIVYKDYLGRYAGYLFKTDDPNTDYDYIQARIRDLSPCCEMLTGPDINITKLRFYSFGSITGANTQPRISIVIEGEAGKDQKTKTAFSVYTSVTQRGTKE